MRIFKNGINVKWLLLAIGIFAISGFAVAATNPIIGDSINYLDALNLTRWARATQFIDADDTTYYVDPANRSKLSGRLQITGNTEPPTGSGSGLELGGSNTDGIVGAYNRNTLTYIDLTLAFSQLYFSGTDSASGDALCLSGTEVVVKTGGTDCTVSAEMYKNIKGKFNDSTVPNKFSQLYPIIFSHKDDIRKLEKFGFNANEVAVLYPQMVYTYYKGNGTFVKVILNQSSPNKADSVLYSDGTIANIEGINYEMFSAILVNQIQNQQFQLDTQSAQIRNICTNAPQLCS